MSNELIFYSTHARELQGNVGRKIQAIIEQRCIVYEPGEKCFLCRPIMQKNGKPYNHTTYKLEHSKDFGFTCDCQAFQTRMKKYSENPISNPKPHCSHYSALYEQFQVWNKERGVGKFRQETLQGTMEMII